MAERSRFPGLLAAIVLLASVAAAQDAAEDEEPIEEITVVGQKSLLNLKIEVNKAEVEFFNLFNELNDNDEFDVFCGKQAGTYSRISRRMCWSPFEREIDEEQVRYAFETGGRLGVRNEGLIRYKRKQQAELLKQMVLENPELQALYRKFGEANIRYVSERAERCGDNIFCRNSDAEDDLESEE